MIPGIWSRHIDAMYSRSQMMLKSVILDDKPKLDLKEGELVQSRIGLLEIVEA